MLHPVPEAPFVDRKGNGRTWIEVRSFIKRLLREAYPRVDRDIIEDAVSDAVVDLLQYWQFLASSSRREATEQLTFIFAVKRGMHTAAASVRSEVIRLDTEGPSGARTEDHAQGFIEDNRDILAPDPAELVCDSDAATRARLVLEAFSDDELHDYFELVVSGKSQRDIAEERGVGRQVIRTRQRQVDTRENRERFRNHCRKHGLG